MYLIWLQEKRNQNFQLKIYHGNGNVNLIEKNVTQIKSGIMMNVDASVKNIIYVKKIKSWILLHVVAKMENVYQVLLTIQ